MIVGCAEECDLESAITGNNRGVDDIGSQERGLYESDGVDINLGNVVMVGTGIYESGVVGVSRVCDCGARFLQA